MDSASNGRVRECVVLARAALTKDVPPAEAISGTGLLTADSQQSLATGDASGRLTEMLRHISSGETAGLQAIDAQFAQWLPKLVYAPVVGWMVSQIPGGAFARGPAHRRIKQRIAVAKRHFFYTVSAFF